MSLCRKQEEEDGRGKLHSEPSKLRIDEESPGPAREAAYAALMKNRRRKTITTISPLQ
jgi:hypothetical protein